jgi:signal transduction histidine kinase
VGAARGSTVIERDGQPVAALIHDPALQYNSELVGSVCAAAGLSLHNERLAAELRARLAELQESRARLVEAPDTERRRIEPDLHDSAQQQLVALRISLGLARQLVTSPPEAEVMSSLLLRPGWRWFRRPAAWRLFPFPAGASRLGFRSRGPCGRG